MYLTSKSDGERRNAEQIILAVIEREKKLLRPGRGFAMYPEYDDAYDDYSRATVRYLWSLNQLDELKDVSRNLRRAATEGLSLADTAAEAHGMERVPMKISSAADAYATANAGDASSTERYFAEILDFSGKAVTIRGSSDSVNTRATLAYAGAAFVAIGQFERAVRLTNQVTRQLNDQGQLYSTLDSVAAIVLMIRLRTAGLVSGEARLRVNGKEMTALEATSSSDQVESIEVLDGVAAVEITRIHEEDWTRFEVGFPVRIRFRDANDKRKKRFRMGERAELVVTLPDGYQVGDLGSRLPTGMLGMDSRRRQGQAVHDGFRGQRRAAHPGDRDLEDRRAAALRRLRPKHVRGGARDHSRAPHGEGSASMADSLACSAATPASAREPAAIEATRAV